MEKVQELERILREKRLTEEQVKAGIRYYVNFASKFDIPPARVAEMIANMIRRMREYYEKA